MDGKASTASGAMQDGPVEEARALGRHEGFISCPVPDQAGKHKPSIKGMLKPLILPMLEKIPFGNVHMALMFGTLIIENGVPE